MPDLDPVVVLTARFALALLFASAAAVKLRHPLYFCANLREYELVPGRLVPTMARVIPLVEIAIALGALLPASARFAMLAGAVLLGVYAAAMGINLVRGRRDIDCGCTGPAARQTLTGWLVFRNAMLILVALCGASTPLARSLGAADIAICVLAVAGGSVLYAAINQLTSNVPRLDALDAYMEQP